MRQSSSDTSNGNGYNNHSGQPLLHGRDDYAASALFMNGPGQSVETR
jgi:hypothetical protein